MGRTATIRKEEEGRGGEDPEEHGGGRSKTRAKKLGGGGLLEGMGHPGAYPLLQQFAWGHCELRRQYIWGS